MAVSRYLANALGQIADREIRSGFSRAASMPNSPIRRSSLSSSSAAPFTDSSSPIYNIEDELRAVREQEEAARRAAEEQAAADAAIAELQKKSSETFQDTMKPSFVKDEEAKAEKSAKDEQKAQSDERKLERERRNKIKESVYSDSEPSDELEKARNEWIKDRVENGYQPERFKSQGIEADKVSFDEALDAWESATDGELTTGIPMLGKEIAKGLATDKLASSINAKKQNQSGNTDMQRQAKELEDAALSMQADWQQSARDITGIGGQAGDTNFTENPGVFALDTLTGLIPGLLSIAPSNMRGASNLLNNSVLNDDMEAEGRLPSQLVADAAGPAIDAASMVFTGGLGAKAAREAIAGSGAKKVAKDLGEAALTEAGQESAQTALEAVSSGNPIEANDLINAAAGGAIGGAAFSGGAAITSGAASKVRNRTAASSGAGVDIVSPADSVSAAGISMPDITSPLATSKIAAPAFSLVNDSASTMPPSTVGQGSAINSAIPNAQAPNMAPQMASQVAQNVSPQVSEALAATEQYSRPGPIEAEQAAAASAAPMNELGAIDVTTPEGAAEIQRRKAEIDQRSQVREQAGEGLGNEVAEAFPTEKASAEPVRRATQAPTNKNIDAALREVVNDVHEANQRINADENAPEAARSLQAAEEDLAAILEPLARRQARANELVSEGKVEMGEATNALLTKWTEEIVADPMAFADASMNETLLKAPATKPSNVISNLRKETSRGAADASTDSILAGAERENIEEVSLPKKERVSDVGGKKVSVKDRSTGKRKTVEGTMTRAEYEAQQNAEKTAPKPTKENTSKKAVDNINWEQVSRDPAETAEKIVNGANADPSKVETHPSDLRTAWAELRGLDPNDKGTKGSFDTIMIDEVREKIEELNRKGTQYDSLRKYYNAAATDLKNSSPEMREAVDTARAERLSKEAEKPADRAKAKRQADRKRAEQRRVRAKKKADELGLEKKRTRAMRGEKVAELTRAEMIEDSVVDLLNDLRYSDLIREASADSETTVSSRINRETDASGFGNENLIRDVLPLSEVQSLVADELGYSNVADLPSHIRDLVNDIYTDDSFRANNYYNRPSKIRFVDGEAKSSDPRAAMFLAAADIKKAGIVSPTDLYRVSITQDGTIYMRDQKGVAATDTVKETVAHLMSVMDNAAPIYISKKGAIENGVVGVSASVNGVDSIILNGEYAFTGGDLSIAGRADQGTVAHEATHVFMRALDKTDSERAVALRERLDQLMKEGHFDEYRQQAEQLYGDQGLSRAEMNEEMIAIAVGDYALRIEDGTVMSLPNVIRSWFDDFVAFLKNTFHLQHFSVNEIFSLDADQLVEIMTKSAFEGVMDNAPSPLVSLSAQEILARSPEEVYEIITDGDEGMKAAVDAAVAKANTVVADAPIEARAESVAAESVKADSSLTAPSKLLYDENGRPMPPWNTTMSQAEFDRIIKHNPLWKQWYDETVKYNADQQSIMDFTPVEYEEVMTVEEAFRRSDEFAGPYSPVGAIVHAGALEWQRRLYDSMAPAIATQNIANARDRKAAKKAIRNKEYSTPEELRELKKMADKSLAVDRVSNAKILQQRARDRISGFSRRVGLKRAYDWMVKNEERQQQARDYMEAREALGALDVLYDGDHTAFTQMARERGFKSTDDLFNWANSTAKNSGLPKKIKESIDKAVKESSDLIVDNAYEAGEISSEHHARLKELNEKGSYWIMKLEKNEVSEARETLLTGDPNALINSTGESLVKSKADQFTTAEEHPITALYAAITLSTFRTDKARLNNAVLSYLVKENLAKEFSIDIYENGMSALPPQKDTGLSDAEYSKLKTIAAEMNKQWVENDGSVGYKYLELFEDGQRRAYAVPPDLYHAMADIGINQSRSRPSVRALSEFARRYSGIVRWFTTTANISLQTVLLVRDLGTIALFGPTKSVSGAFGMPVYMAKGLYQTLFKNSWLSEVGIAGDAFTRAALRDPRAEAQKAFAIGDLNPSKAKLYSDKALSAVEHGLNMMETFARSTLYNQALKAYKDGGLSEADAHAKAVTTAAEGIGNFREAGSWVRGVSMYSAYANASLQGAVGAVKLFSKQPAFNLLRATTAIAAISFGSALMVAAAGYDWDEWQKVVKALPDSQKHRGIPMPKPDEAPQLVTDKNDPDYGKLKGVWMFPMPEILYPVLNIVNDPTHESRTQEEAAFDILTLFFSGLTGFDVHGNSAEDMSRNLFNQWVPNVTKPFIELGANVSLYSGNEILPADQVESWKAGGMSRNAIDSYGTSENEKMIADFLSNYTPLDVNAADIDVLASSAGSMLSNLADGKFLLSFGGVTDPFYSKKAASPVNDQELVNILRNGKWNSTEYGLSNSQKQSAEDDLRQQLAEATKLFNAMSYQDMSKEDLRALVEGNAELSDRAALIAAVEIASLDKGWDKKQTAEEIARLYPKNSGDLFDETKFSKEDVVEFYSYVGVLGEAFDSPRLKAQATLAQSDRFWKPGMTGDDRSSMMERLRGDYKTVADLTSQINSTMADSENPNREAITKELTKDLKDGRLKILFDRYDQEFDPELWYSDTDSNNELRDMLKADTDSVTDQEYNRIALKYYEALYSADGTLYRDRDDLSRKDSSGYLYTAAKINSDYDVPKYIQLAYGDAGTSSNSEFNVSLTAWRELEETDPELFQLLYDYDTIRTEAGVSRNKKSEERKYYLKESSGKGGYGRRGGGGYGGGGGSFHVPSVADLTMKTYTPKGNTTSTSTSVKARSVAPISYTTVGKTASGGSGIKTNPTNFKGAKTVKYKKAETRQPAMGEPYQTFLKGGSAQDSFKAARRYI